MADPNLAERPRTEPKQRNLQAMDLGDIDMDTSLEARDSGWVARLTEAPTDNGVFDAVIADVADAAAEEPVSQNLSIPANDDSLSSNNQNSADSNDFEDYFDYDMYVEDKS